MKRTPCFAITICIVFGSLFLHPFGDVKGVSRHQEATLGGGGANMAATFEKSCQNCHSTKTVWPWYSYVPPVSWMIERDVAAARTHMNFDQWQTYNIDEKLRRLSEIGSLVRNRVMPPDRYILLHPEARLSNDEIARISEWARRERARLKVQDQVN